jgi:CRISPR system Cascade subunit CasB
MTTTAPPAAGTAPKKQRACDRFVEYVHELCQSNRTRAELRRGLALPVERCNYLHRYIVPFLSEQYGERLGGAGRRAYYAVAALIAARPRSARDPEPPGWVDGRPTQDWWDRPNMGASLARAVKAGVLKEGSAENTLHLMSRQSADSVHAALPALVRQILNGGVPVDWSVLLEDLLRWDDDRDLVATRWLESYFRVLSTAPEPDAEGTDD